jgi:hypothetical protein
MSFRVIKRHIMSFYVILCHIMFFGLIHTAIHLSREGGGRVQYVFLGLWRQLCCQAEGKNAVAGSICVTHWFIDREITCFPLPLTSVLTAIEIFVLLETLMLLASFAIGCRAACCRDRKRQQGLINIGGGSGGGTGKGPCTLAS